MIPLEGEALPARRVVGAALLLIGAVLGAYWGVWDNGFVNYDDGDYVTDNALVRSGVTAQSLYGAFTQLHASNWHPLTWISHMLDVELFGLDPAGHHAVSLGLHALNAALAFLALLRLTRWFWPSLLAAALFALHPQRVESVAWVSERKDLLSGTCFLLALLAYEAWARRGGGSRYAASCAAFALGLSAKPMLVTLPCVLLLLDYWPLRRTLEWRRVAEKLPLFALAAASCAVTAIAQKRGGAVDSLGFVPISMRIANAATSYWAYLGQTFAPAGLAPLYPHPLARPLEPASAWTSASVGALIALLLASAAALLAARRCRALPVGWLWFVGMLVPVIGLVQVGIQARADRYTYLPSIGFAVALLFGGHALVRVRPVLARVCAAVTVLALIALAACTHAQVRFWRDSVTLWTRTLEVTRDNYLAHANLGSALGDAREIERAEQHYRRALEIHPGHDNSNNGLGLCLAERGSYDEALVFLGRALQANPSHWQAYNNIGLIHGRHGRFQQALRMFERADELHPGNAAVLGNLGGALMGLAGDDRPALERAAARLEQALAIDPSLADARSNLEQLRQRLGPRSQAPALR